MKKIIVYTSISGSYDGCRKDKIKCFSDFEKFTLPVYNSKIYKVLAHQFVDSDISIWIDGNIYLKASPSQIVEEMLGDADLGLFKHPVRNCIYKERDAAIFHRPLLKDEIYSQTERYLEKGYPVDNGLYECGVLIRRHSSKMESFNNSWWSEICRHSSRDQLSFPYVLSKFPSIKIKCTQGDVRTDKRFTYINRNNL